ncbi:MAG: transglycosylase domain-containing protein [Anaerolineae bacterium]|nr:transglycosylase domain-containing protein [Anaerolineae bacterium]
MADQPENKQSKSPDEDPVTQGEQKPETPPTGAWQTPPERGDKPPEIVASWHEPPVEEGSSRPVIVEQWFTPENAITPEEQPPGDTSEVKPTGAPVDLPGLAPEKTGGWFMPAESQLEALLAGAGDTIVEFHEKQPVPQDDMTQPQAAADTQAQLAAGDTQAVADTQAQPPAGEEAVIAPGEGWAAPGEAAEGAELQVPAEEAVEEMSAEAEAAPAEPGSEEEPTEVAAEAVIEAVIEEPAVAAESTPPPDATPSAGLSPAEAAFLSEQRAAGVSPEASPDQDTGAAALSDSQAAQPGAAQAAPPQPSPFDEVERKVNVLRQRYNSGHLTREELQNELRGLMILDDDGHWWMMGIETNQWYYFDGRDWVQAIPPGREQAVRGSAVRTETGLQEVIADTSAQWGEDDGVIERTEIALDEDGFPLPVKVPQDDPGATLVSPSTPFMEPMRRSDAPTHPKLGSVAGETAGIPHPAGDQLTQPSRPVSGAGDTIRSDRVLMDGDQQTVPGAAMGLDIEAPGAESTISHGLPVAPGEESAEKPKRKPKIGEFPQPDYSLALGFSRNRNTYVKWGIRVAVFAIIGGMALSLLVLLGMVGYYFNKVNQYSDAVATLGDRAATFETTQIIDANGTTLAEFGDEEARMRKSVPLDQISPWLIHATIATENETFYSDPGFSVMAILRATYQNLRTGDTVSGASTITQQLARALVLETEFAYQRTTERKVVEIIVASEIKRKYSKNEILEIYLNEIFYGNFAYGIETAAQTYFNKSASSLNPAEAAFLAGLPQSPATYDPVINREAALGRMDTVLRLMAEANGSGCIAIEHADTTQWAIPNGGELCIRVEDRPGDPLYFYKTPTMEAWEEMTLDIALVKTAPFSPPAFRAEHPHFVNYVWQQLEDTYGSQAIYSAGYRVYTTLDARTQDAAEQAVTENLAALQARGVDATNASVVVMRPADGAVLAMVGSADYYNEDIDGQVNVAFTAQQPGSSIKPIVYLTAFEADDNGNYLTPSTVLWDVYTDFSGYIPTNYDLLYHGPKTARAALGNSLNVPAVKALEFAGLERFTEMAKRVGLTFPLGDPVERQAGLPTALGAVEVRLFDMVDAFAVLANNGRRVDPYSIVYIEDSEGNEMYRADTSPEGLQVVQPELAYLVTSILADNESRAEEFGRGWPMELQGGRLAAIKTGTTTDARDTWAIGYTPQRVVGVWVGNSDNRPMYGISGYSSAAPIWNAVMEASHEGLAAEQFLQPAGIIQMEVCADSGAQPSPACAGRTRWDIFANTAPPPGADKDIFRTMNVDSYTGKLANEYCPDEVESRTFLAINDSSAYNWINNTGEGNAWADSRGLELPLMPPPNEACNPNEVRPTVVLSFPPEGMTVEGVLPLRGAITMPDFNRYEVRYGVSYEAEAFSQPVIVEVGQRSDADSLLGQIDTRGMENGPYTLQLVAIDNYGRSVTREVHITINNPQPTAVPTALPTPTLAPTFTLPPGVQPTAEPGGVLPTPTLAPSLTPTWTLTPTPAQ